MPKFDLALGRVPGPTTSIGMGFSLLIVLLPCGALMMLGGIRDLSLFPGSFQSPPRLWYPDMPPLGLVFLQAALPLLGLLPVSLIGGHDAFWKPVVTALLISTFSWVLFYGELRGGVALLEDHVLIRPATPWSFDRLISFKSFYRLERGCIYDPRGKRVFIQPTYRLYERGRRHSSGNVWRYVDLGRALDWRSRDLGEEVVVWLQEVSRFGRKASFVEVASKPYDAYCEKVFSRDLNEAGRLRFRSLLLGYPAATR